MSITSLELFKKHVRADDFGDDDKYLDYLLSTAEQVVVRATGRTLDELMEMERGVLPLPLVQASMMLAAHWYNQREAVSGVQMTEVPDSLRTLVNPYRRLT